MNKCKIKYLLEFIEFLLDCIFLGYFDFRACYLFGIVIC